MTDLTAEETATVDAGEPAAKCSPEAGLDVIDEQLINRSHVTATRTRRRSWSR
jgi:hypothetical protein